MTFLRWTEMSFCHWLENDFVIIHFPSVFLCLFETGTVAGNGPQAPNNYNHVDNKMGKALFCYTSLSSTSFACPKCSTALEWKFLQNYLKYLILKRHDDLNAKKYSIIAKIRSEGAQSSHWTLMLMSPSAQTGRQQYDRDCTRVSFTFFQITTCLRLASTGGGAKQRQTEGAREVW